MHGWIPLVGRIHGHQGIDPCVSPIRGRGKRRKLSRDEADTPETENVMLRRRREQSTATTTTVAPAFADLHDWVLSLPWVVERPSSLATPGVRCFGVDCAPLGRRQLWLITGMECRLDPDGVGLAVIVPAEIANDFEDMRWGHVVAPMPGCHALVTVHANSFAGWQDFEALLLTAYGCAMS
jgi:hypothetical protein